MPIVIPRNGEFNTNPTPVPQEVRDALWAAFVTSWLDKHSDEFVEALNAPETVPVVCH